MTTIAYRDGVLAADTRATVNGWTQLHTVRKLFRTHDGSICRDGLRIYEGTGSFVADCDFTAFGSGSIAAQAAMVMGADAEKAVRVASMFDDATGSDVVVMRLGEP